VKLLADLTPLRESPPAFRRIWAGSTLSAVPLLAAGLFGGALIDAVDTRRLVPARQQAPAQALQRISFQVCREVAPQRKFTIRSFRTDPAFLGRGRFHVHRGPPGFPALPAGRAWQRGGRRPGLDR
jgi:hypothetical protein